MKLPKEEQHLLDSVEQEERKCIPDFENEQIRYQEAARSEIQDILRGIQEVESGMVSEYHFG